MKKYCYCGSDISHLHYSKKWCSEECRYNHWVSKENKKNADKDWPVCKICGLKRKVLQIHIKKVHKTSVHEYYKKFNCSTEDVFHHSTLKKMSNNVKGKNNPAYNHGGKFSPVSKNFVKYKGLSDEEIESKIQSVKKNIKKVKDDEPWRRGNNNIEYFLHKGYTREEAEKALSERQSTFSLKKCVERYGKEKGKQRWKERQENWQNTLNSKPKEEIERINRAKMFKRSFSLISQKLFWQLYEDIRDDFNIYFAELGVGGVKDDSGRNNEYMVEIGYRKLAFLDFFVKDLNKIIEFDGEYWHGESRGNKKRDEERDIKLTKMGYKVLHVRGRDYKSNPDSVIKECKNFLYGTT